MWKGSKHKTTQKSALTPRGKLARSEIAKRRLKLRMLMGALALVGVTGLFGGLSWLSFFGPLNVQHIVVEGNTGVKTRALQASAMLATADASGWFFSRQNTFFYPRAELETMLAFEFPKLETVEVRTHPTKQQATIVVTERQPYALWCRDGDCYYVDNDGFIYEKALRPGSLVRFYNGVEESRSQPIRSYVAPESFAAVHDFFSQLQQSGLEVQSLTFDGEDAMLRLSPGWELRVALEKDLGAAAFNLKAVLDEHNLRSQLDNVLYIDMRFDERVYYKLKNEDIDAS